MSVPEEVAASARAAVPRVEGAEPIDLVVVGVPARNEQERIGECLASIDRAARRWGGTVITVVGADSCSDQTGSIARAFAPAAMAVHTLEGNWRRPSKARRAVVGHACDDVAPARRGRVWIANTDADCVVPVDWIARQVDMANAGADLVVGVVRLDPSDTPVSLLAAFTAHYQRDVGRGHVHAANLGLRASAYQAIGGWRASTAIGEEHHLLNSAVRRNLAVCWADDLVVRTSGRTTSRVRGGFASVLDRLQRESVVAADSA